MMQKTSHSYISRVLYRLNRVENLHYSTIVIILSSSCLVFSILFLPTSNSTSGSQKFYDGLYKEFACQGEISIANSQGLYRVDFIPAHSGQGHGYGGFALQRNHRVTPETCFTVTLRVGQAEINPEKKMRAKFLVHVECSDGEIWEICFEAAIWRNHIDEDFFDGIRPYRLDASSPPIIYLGYGHEPDKYVGGNYNIQNLFEQYQINVKPLTITEVAFEAWTNNVQAFSAGECIHAYFQAGNIIEQASM